MCIMFQYFVIYYQQGNYYDYKKTDSIPSHPVVAKHIRTAARCTEWRGLHRSSLPDGVPVKLLSNGKDVFHDQQLRFSLQVFGQIALYRLFKVQISSNFAYR